MSTEKEITFDPYHKWLGIPKAQRPPTHYQLLGLAQGETDAEVIEEAAIRQTTHLRAYQVGPHAADCTRLLNEISGARQVLVNPQKRQDYDAKLAQLAAKRAALDVNSKTVQPVIDSAFADLETDIKPPASSTRLKREAAKPTKPGKNGKKPESKDEQAGLPRNLILGAAAGGGVLIVGIVAVVAFLLSPPPAPPPLPIAQNKGQPPVVVPPPKQQIVDIKVDPKVEPKPAPIAKVDPEPIPFGTPKLRQLGGVLLKTPAKAMQALADGRLYYNGYPVIQQIDPARGSPLMAQSITGTGERGNRFAFSADGKTMYVATPDLERAAAIDLATKTTRGNLAGAGEVSCLKLSRDGRTLVTGSYLGDVQAYDAATCQQQQRLAKHPRPVQAIVFSRDGSLVATMCDQTVHVWNLRFGRLVSTAPIVPDATSIEFSPDGQSLLAASPTGLHQGAVNNLKWSFLKAGRDAFLQIAFANDKTLVVLGAHAVALYDWPTLKIEKHTAVIGDSLETLALSPDGKILFAARKTTPLEIFAIDDDAVLKPYSPDAAPPVVPQPPIPPSSNDPYVGTWQYLSKPSGSIRCEVAIRKVGTGYSAQINMTRPGKVGKAHADNLSLLAGKLRGAVVIDSFAPAPWTNLNEISVDVPQGNDLHVELRGDTINSHTMHRVGSTEPPMPPDVPVPPKMPPVTPKVDVPVVRVDPPSDDKIKEIAATIRDNFKADYAKKTSADRQTLAEKLLQLAVEEKNDPVARYALCIEVRDLAAAAGKWSIVADAFELIDNHYKVDVLPQKEAALQMLVKSGLNKESAVEATEAALQGVHDSVVADQLPLATGFLGLASTSSAKSLSVPHISLVKKTDGELKLVNQEAEAVKKARESLKASPDDAGANFAVGRYDALRRGDWDKALAMLAKGGDSELSAAARKDIAAPKDGAAQKELADNWFSLAEKEKDSSWIRAALQDRAAHWYRSAAPQVAGLTLAGVNTRLKTIEETPSPFRLGAGGSGMTELKSLRGHKAAVTSLHLALDGKRLFSGSLDATVKSWDLKLAKNLTTFQTIGPIYSLAFSPNGRYIALGFKDTMKVIDANDPAAIGGRMPSGTAWPGTSFFDDEKVYYVNSGSFGTKSVTFGTGGSGPNPMRSSAWVPSTARQFLLTYGEETWLCGTPGGGLFPRNKLSIAAESTAALFAPNEQSAAVATVDKKIHLFDVQSRNELGVLDGGGGVVRCMVYVPGGDRLITGGEDGSVCIWDVAARKEVRRFSNASKGVTSILVSPDAKQIITGGSDGVIRVWAMPREKAVKSGS